jgi:hypothetical protein
VVGRLRPPENVAVRLFQHNRPRADVHVSHINDTKGNPMALNRAKPPNIAWAAVLLIFSPSRLVAHSVDYAIRSQPGEMAPEQAAALRKSFQNQFASAISLLRITLGVAFAIVTGSILAAYCSAWLLHVLSVKKAAEVNDWLQYGGIGVLLWATLGRVDSPIQTWDAATLPEMVDLWLYRWLYIAGSYTLALSVAW